MRKLAANILIFSLPLIVSLLFFAIDDPFGVLFKEHCLAEPSEDITSTRNFLNNAGKEQYSSYIFGNSRVHCFSSSDLSDFFGDRNTFSFGAPGESILNMKKKVSMIFSKNIKLKNAIILIDEGILQNTNNEQPFFRGPVYNHGPLTSNISYFAFYSEYLKYYFSDLFFIKHIYYRTTSHYIPGWMNTSFKEQSGESVVLKSAHGEKKYQYASLADSLIENNFPEYKRKFSPNYSDNYKNIGRIDARDLVHLSEIKQSLDKNSSRYMILIPPAFHKHKISANVYHQLDSVFPGRVFDFTGINKITTDSTLNYENLHFTARAGKMVLDSIKSRF